MAYLTKSRFKLALSCPTKLYYGTKENNYENTQSDDRFMKALAEGGYQVVELAKFFISDNPVADNISIDALGYEDSLRITRNKRAEHLSLLIKNILDINIDSAKGYMNKIKIKYPIVLTRDLSKAKIWLKSKARGSECYGIVVSSQAQRLKPYAIDVKSPMDPIHWFLDEKQDVRSSYYM